jgi:glucose/arabinose dehydrogenase
MKNIFLNVILILFFCPQFLSAQTFLDTEFSQSTVVSGMASSTTFAFAPDGRIFVCEKNGKLRVVKNNTLLPTEAILLTVQPSGERGLIGVAVDPAFATNNFVYLYYTVPSPLHNRVSRFTFSGDVISPVSEQILVELDGLSATNHNGGALAFGPDGKLYIAVGDNAVSANSQSLANRHGKILRINADGSIPTDNPSSFAGISGSPTGANMAIWCVGLRNPYTMAFNAANGLFFVNDVGGGGWEEINDCTVGGKNYGWPQTEGVFNQSSFPNYTLPVYAYGHGSGPGVGNAITGGCFLTASNSNYSTEYIGNYFYMDWTSNWIERLVFTQPNMTKTTENARIKGNLAWASSLFATGTSGGGLAINVGADGNLYYVSGGSLLKIVSSNVALPIKLQKFTAQAAGANALLQWSSSDETNFSHFEVYRSANNTQWLKLANVDFVPETEKQQYEYLDSQAGTGIFYYKLKMVDKNGKAEFSKVLSVSLDAARLGLSISPNPSSQFINIGNMPSSQAELGVYGANGLLYSTLAQNKKDELGQIVVDISKLPTGKYICVVGDKASSFLKK